MKTFIRLYTLIIIILLRNGLSKEEYKKMGWEVEYKQRGCDILTCKMVTKRTKLANICHIVVVKHFRSRRPRRSKDLQDPRKLLYKWAGLSNLLMDISPSTVEDTKVWALESNGIYSVKSFLPKLINTQMQASEWIDTLIWRLDIPKTIKVFLWIFTKEMLKTCCRLQKLLPNLALCPNWCVLCRKNEEDAVHLSVFFPFDAAVGGICSIRAALVGCFLTRPQMLSIN